MFLPQLIVFDLDGVLANTEHFYMSSISDALIQQGFTKYTTDYCEKYLSGKATPLILQIIDQEEDRPLDSNFFEFVIKKHYKEFEKHIHIMEGVETFLKKLTIPYCLASSSSMVQIKRTLKAIHLDKYFPDNHIFTCYSINKFKPNPAIYLEVLKKMHSTPKEAIAIEDSVSGVKAAVGAQIPTVGFVGADYLKGRADAHGDLLMANGAFTIKHSYQELHHLFNE